MGRIYLIPVRSACNADCPFCITRIERTKPAFDALPEIMPLGMLRHTLSDLPSNVTEIEITGGGEPQLHQGLAQIIGLLREWRPTAKLKLYTNGFLLRDLPRVDEVNISRCHYDTAKNQELYLGKPATDVKEALAFYRTRADRLRLQIPLIRGYTDCEAVAREWIARFPEADQFVFRPLFSGVELMTDKRVDFQFEHPKAKWDNIDATYCGSRPVIASSGTLFKDWDFEQPLMDMKELERNLAEFRRPEDRP